VKAGGVLMTSKPYDIPKSVVVEAWKQVRANKGSAGIDDESIKDFEKDWKNNLYKIWNRMSSGSYFPPSVKSVETPKKAGGTRRLGIPTVGDRVAQAVVKICLEPRLEEIFHADSYGYRPEKSALDAIAQTRQRCWKYDYVVEFDIKGLFDNIDHKLLMKAVDKHVSESWIKLYINRWLMASFEDQSGNKIERNSGTPQGGVISPLLANLFMHYAFDMWMKREHPDCPFERYADDAVIHCRTELEAINVLQHLTERLNECKLELNLTKTRIVYCKDRDRTEKYPNIEFDFLGYTFRGRYIKNKTGKLRTNFIAAVSRKSEKSFRNKLRDLKIHRKTSTSMEDIAKQINPMVRGWLNYFSVFCKTKVGYTMKCLNARLCAWARRKYKHLRKHKNNAWKWLQTVAKSNPTLFAHWKMGWQP
jgi:group II intron reverse transcriptase/maturase